ncbi:MAG TPA: hypothetical protein DHU96_32945 [Actinobacteria bacterium]|nr:hypothetical protein [Actinomycetota bacterium]
MNGIDEHFGVHGYRSFPLTGSPAGRLQDDSARILAAGLLPHCPHPDQPAFWYLPAGVLACAPCTDQFIETSGESADCHACGGPASAVAAWVTGGVPCIAGLCEQCRGTGLVPLAPN